MKRPRSLIQTGEGRGQGGQKTRCPPSSAVRQDRGYPSSVVRLQQVALAAQARAASTFSFKAAAPTAPITTSGPMT
jgi:hypothetical protein